MIFSSKINIRIPQVPAHEATLIGAPEEEVALVDGETSRSHTYTEVGWLMEAVGSGLTRLGVKKGDVVAFYCPNGNHFVFGILGCFSIGAVFTGINPNYKQYELGHQLVDCQAKIVVTSAANLPTLKEVLNSKEYDTGVQTIITIDTEADDVVHFEDLLNDDGSAFPHGLTFDVHEDVATIFYSSGTTGLPKGVMLTHYQFVSSLLAFRHNMFNLPGYVTTLIVLPMFHIFGLHLVLSTFCSRGKAVILNGFKPDIFLKSIQDHKINVLYLVPPLVNFLAKHTLVDNYNIGSIKFVMSAAAPLSADIEKIFLERLKLDTIYQGYGVTEYSGPIVRIPYDKSVRGSSGILVANTSVKIVDLVSRKPLGIDEEGEILVKGPGLMKGYLNKPEATRNTMEDGWLCTGDLGYFNKDEYLFITGRIKELIKHKGFQVAPAQLEGLLLSHPSITDVAVIGIEDEIAGELPRAFVVKKENCNLTEEDVCLFVQEQLVKHKWLSGGVQFVESIPKSASGKILRGEVKCLLKNV